MLQNDKSIPNLQGIVLILLNSVIVRESKESYCVYS